MSEESQSAWSNQPSRFGFPNQRGWRSVGTWQDAKWTWMRSHDSSIEWRLCDLRVCSSYHGSVAERDPEEKLFIFTDIAFHQLCDQMALKHLIYQLHFCSNKEENSQSTHTVFTFLRRDPVKEVLLNLSGVQVTCPAQTEHVQTSVVVLNMMAAMRPSVFLLFHFYMNSFDLIKINPYCVLSWFLCTGVCVQYNTTVLQQSHLHGSL